MECDNRFYLYTYTGHRFLCTISSTSVTIKKSPLSNFRIVSEQGRTKDLKTQNWQLYKSPERASAVSTNIWGDQPSRRSGSGFIMFGSEAWVPVTSLGACDQSVCLEEYQLPVELDTKDLPQFHILLLLGSAPGESWVVWVDRAWHCMSPIYNAGTGVTEILVASAVQVCCQLCLWLQCMQLNKNLPSPEHETTVPHHRPQPPLP